MLGPRNKGVETKKHLGPRQGPKLQKMSCTPEVLVDADGVNISICKGCKMIGFSFYNNIIGFEKKDFKTFVRSFSLIEFEKCCVMFPGGERQLIINSMHRDIQFNFKQSEFKKIANHLNQALALLSAKEILS